MAHPNEQLIRRGYEAFANGDMDTLRALFAPDIAWHVSGTNPLSGDYHGLDEVLGLFGRVQQLADSLEFDVHDVLANDEHVVALLKVRATRGDDILEGDAIQVFHVADGQITEFWGTPFDQAAADEFWS